MSNKTKFNQKNNRCFTCVREKIKSVFSAVGWTSVVDRSWAAELLEISSPFVIDVAGIIGQSSLTVYPLYKMVALHLRAVKL